MPLALGDNETNNVRVARCSDRIAGLRPGPRLTRGVFRIRAEADPRGDPVAEYLSRTYNEAPWGAASNPASAAASRKGSSIPRQKQIN